VTRSETGVAVFRGQEGRRFSAGDLVFAEGDAATCLYVVRAGKVSLRVAARELETVGEGGLFGELALVDDAPRSATAIALTDSELVEIDERRFRFLVGETPFFALTVMRAMAARLRRESSPPVASAEGVAGESTIAV
jgi:CRP/FNR family cyclic AMP-dependent transcriptional regulator